jgi:ubiquinol-cytochrome c reductase cytochrome c1 subunit
MRLVRFALAAALAFAPAAVFAEQTEPLLTADWSFTGPFGTYDGATARRGLQVYTEVCAACHGLGLVAYRNLAALGVSENEAKALAAKAEVEDGPDETGAMFKRPALLSDRFVAPFPNTKAARAANGGALPPDLSLITKARKGGPDYVYSLMQGYGEPPAGVTVAPGMNYNRFFPGHQIAMPAPLMDDFVQYPDGTKATVQQMAHDVTEFLMWAAEPNLPARKAIGFGVMIFLVLLTGLFYATKRSVWRDVH